MDIYQYVSSFYQSATAEKQIIGKSLLGRNIYAVKIGCGRPAGIVQYAIHGREYIVAKLALLHAELGVHTGSCWLVPLANPDGALLSECGLSSVTDEKCKNKLLALNKQSADFSLWKANARGVDLNVNFAADWGKGVKNVRTAGAENFIGARPFSEPETLALRNFTFKIKPDYTVSYHTKGEEIYWHFGQSTRTYPRDKTLAQVLSRATGYPLCEAKGSAGGYKDWCIQRLHIPSFTIEAGADIFTHPIGEEGLENILTKNEFALQRLSDACAAIL
jgi:hypothetical protein